MPPRGNQPQERVCEANWRRSLCAAKRDPRLRGCTPLRTPIRKSEGAGAKRTQYYCPFLTPPPLPPLLSREFPRTPAVFNGCYNLGRQPAKGSPFRGAGRASWPEGSRRALRRHPFPGSPPPTAKGVGCRPPLPLSSATHLRHPVGAGHARPAALRQLPVSFCIPFIFYIVGRGCGVANRGHG